MLCHLVTGEIDHLGISTLSIPRSRLSRDWIKVKTSIHLPIETTSPCPRLTWTWSAHYAEQLTCSLENLDGSGKICVCAKNIVNKKICKMYTHRHGICIYVWDKRTHPNPQPHIPSWSVPRRPCQVVVSPRSLPFTLLTNSTGSIAFQPYYSSSCNTEVKKAWLRKMNIVPHLQIISNAVYEGT